MFLILLKTQEYNLKIGQLLLIFQYQQWCLESLDTFSIAQTHN